jgi:hypothetical protein
VNFGSLPFCCPCPLLKKAEQIGKLSQKNSPRVLELLWKSFPFLVISGTQNGSLKNGSLERTYYIKKARPCEQAFLVVCENVAKSYLLNYMKNNILCSVVV